MSDTRKKGNYICPICKTAKFDTQSKLLSHALPCKRGEVVPEIKEQSEPVEKQNQGGYL